jgi:hypothetical protein
MYNSFQLSMLLRYLHLNRHRQHYKIHCDDVCPLFFFLLINPFLHKLSPTFHIVIQVLITKIYKSSFMFVLLLYVQFVFPLLQVNYPMIASVFWFDILPNMGSSVNVFQISFFNFYLFYFQTPALHG